MVFAKWKFSEVDKQLPFISALESREPSMRINLPAHSPPQPQCAPADAGFRSRNAQIFTLEFGRIQRPVDLLAYLILSEFLAVQMTFRYREKRVRYINLLAINQPGPFID